MPTAKKIQEERLEKKLWKTADKLRKNIDVAEYKHSRRSAETIGMENNRLGLRGKKKAYSANILNKKYVNRKRRKQKKRRF